MKFEEKSKSKSTTPRKDAPTIPEMIEILREQQQALLSLKDKLSAPLSEEKQRDGGKGNGANNLKNNGGGSKGSYGGNKGKGAGGKNAKGDKGKSGNSNNKKGTQKRP